jgi:hypothetical protein
MTIEEKGKNPVVLYQGAAIILACQYLPIDRL